MIEVNFSTQTEVTVGNISQYTHHFLKINDLTLPDVFEVNFSHSGMTVTMCQRIGRTYNTTSVIPVPDYLMTATGTITATFEGYTIHIPIIAASKPAKYDITPQNDTDPDQAMIGEALRYNDNVRDVYQNGTSVVDANHVAQITVPENTSDLNNDSGFVSAVFDSINDETGVFKIGDFIAEWGIVTITPVNGEGTEQITFENEFSFIPLIQCTFAESDGSLKTVAAINATTTGFEAWMNVDVDAARNIRWLAIGKG